MTDVKLIISKIPDSLNEANIKEILDKCIKDRYTSLKFVKPSHQYSSKFNNLCFLTVKDLDTRLGLMKYLSEFDLILRGGGKHKLCIETCIVQQIKDDVEEVEDSIEATYSQLEHFKEFKECFEKGEIIGFKGSNLLI